MLGRHSTKSDKNRRPFLRALRANRTLNSKLQNHSYVYLSQVCRKHPTVANQEELASAADWEGRLRVVTTSLLEAGNGRKSTENKVITLSKLP